MRVLIDDGFSIAAHTGIGRYTESIRRALKEQAPGVELLDATNRLQRIKPKHLRRMLYLAQMALPSYSRIAPGIVHFTNYMAPFFKRRGVRYATTIHDLTVFRFPETKSKAYGLYLRTAIRNALRISDVIFTDCEAVKKELVDDLHADPDRIAVCYVRPELQATVAGNAGASTFQNPCGNAPFVLSVGTLETRKNLGVLIQAVAQLRAQHSDVHLILVGRPGPGYAAIAQVLKECDPDGKWVHILSRCDDAQLIALYRSCATFAFPSIYEGYGLPLLEAMSFNAPVVASDIPTNLELLAGAGKIFSGGAVELAAALAGVIGSTQTADELRRAGLLRSQHFTDALTAQQLLAGYHRALS